MSRSDSWALTSGESTRGWLRNSTSPLGMFIHPVASPPPAALDSSQAMSNVERTVAVMLVNPAANASRIDHVRSPLEGWSPPRIQGRTTRTSVSTVVTISFRNGPSIQWRPDASHPECGGVSLHLGIRSSKSNVHTRSLIAYCTGEPSRPTLWVQPWGERWLAPRLSPILDSRTVPARRGRRTQPRHIDVGVDVSALLRGCRHRRRIRPRAGQRQPLAAWREAGPLHDRDPCCVQAAA